MKNDLTNQQLLNEIEKRIAEGSISFTSQTEPVSNPFSINTNSLLMIAVFIALFYFSTRISVTKSSIQLKDNN